jgi:hypothetical protein
MCLQMIREQRKKPATEMLSVLPRFKAADKEVEHRESDLRKERCDCTRNDSSVRCAKQVSLQRGRSRGEQRLHMVVCCIVLCGDNITCLDIASAAAEYTVDNARQRPTMEHDVWRLFRK